MYLLLQMFTLFYKYGNNFVQNVVHNIQCSFGKYNLYFMNYKKKQTKEVLQITQSQVQFINSVNSFKQDQTIKSSIWTTVINKSTD